MDYEKAYNKALERAKKWYNAPNADKIPTYANRIIVEIFPELSESEDERIRKALVRFHKSTIDVDGIKGEEIVAWLEKQAEQRKQLIDKACDVLVNCIEDFMLRRMEIWDEECKKQTLENIRKTLEK